MEDLEVVREGVELAGVAFSRGRSCNEVFSSIAAVCEGGEVLVRVKLG
jgi:hypothetical protein